MHVCIQVLQTQIARYCLGIKMIGNFYKGIVGS